MSGKRWSAGSRRSPGSLAALAVMDFRFLGGSLGTGVGERLVRLAEHAVAHRLPLVVVTASGGARMQEGALSLMQMAKASQAVAQLNEAGLLFVTLITDPTFGGVAASFATQADVIIAEPGARMGFAGPRVIRDTVRATLPDGFQTAEFLLDHGAIDLVAERNALRGGARAACCGPPRRHPGRPTQRPVPIVVDADELAERTRLGRRGARPARPAAHRPRVHHPARRFVRRAARRPAMRRLRRASSAGSSTSAAPRSWWSATQKGHATRELVETNFGMAEPEGYRKALRLMRLAGQLRPAGASR